MKVDHLGNVIAGGRQDPLSQLTVFSKRKLPAESAFIGVYPRSNKQSKGRR
jgi:hypothetical protein